MLMCLFIPALPAGRPITPGRVGPTRGDPCKEWEIHLTMAWRSKFPTRQADSTSQQGRKLFHFLMAVFLTSNLLIFIPGWQGQERRGSQSERARS